ncbi:hypothetical protein ABK040_004873 [Willaertia magna]
MDALATTVINTSSNQQSPLSTLSHQSDILLTIFNYLPLEELLTSFSLTCKDWNHLINETSLLWRNICINELGWPININTDEYLFQLDVQSKIESGQLDLLSSPLPTSNLNNIFTKSNIERAITLCNEVISWKEFCKILHFPANLNYFSNSTADATFCEGFYEKITKRRYVPHSSASLTVNNNNEEEEEDDLEGYLYKVFKGKLIDCLHLERAILDTQLVLTEIKCDKLYLKFIKNLEKIQSKFLPSLEIEDKTRYHEKMLIKNKFSFKFTKDNFEIMEEYLIKNIKNNYSLFSVYLLNDASHSVTEVVSQLKLAFNNNISFEFSDKIMYKAHANDEAILLESNNLERILEIIKILTAIDLHCLLTISEMDALQMIRKRYAINLDLLDLYYEFKPEQMEINFDKVLETCDKKEDFVVELFSGNHTPQVFVQSLMSIFPSLQVEDCIGMLYTIYSYGSVYVAKGSFDLCKEVAIKLTKASFNVVIKSDKQAMRESEENDNDAQEEDEDLEQ